MTKDQLDRIESVLGIRLPTDYREWAERLPAPGQECESWHWAFNDPDALIEENLRLRDEGCLSAEWPSHLFCIAEADENYYFLDLRDSTAIYYTNHDAGPYFQYPDLSECFYRAADVFYRES